MTGTDVRIRGGRISAILAALALTVAPARASAHEAGFSRGTYVLEGDTLTVELLGSAHEFGLSSDSKGGASSGALLGRIGVLQDGRPCAFASGPLAPQAPGGFEAKGSWRCPRAITWVDVHLPFLADLHPNHTHLADVRDLRSETAVTTRHMVRRADPSFTAGVREKPAWRRAASFAHLGIEHILLGFDHLAFLVAVLLAAPTLRRVVQLVTSFTVAHSITLALAATGTLTISPRVVEPLIAVSIVAVALENLWLMRRGVDAAARERAVRRRWIVTFVFGLVHGLGFAGALGAVRLTGGAFVLALASFNVGVELGQIAVAGVLVLVLLAARRSARLAPRVAHAGSVAVALAGLLWLAERVASAG